MFCRIVCKAMNSRRFAVCLGIGLTFSFASVAIYVLTSRKYRRKKNEDEGDNLETQNFPFLTDDHCIKFIMNSKVVFIMRGLPGSGKSAVARQIKQVYGDLAVMCSVEDFREEAEECETRQRMMCQEKAKRACQNGTPVVIIDNMNIKKTLLYDYVDIARSAGYYVVLVEPKTSWKYNISDLALRNHQKVSEEVLGELLSEFEQIVAVYYGWFLSENSSKTLKDGLFGVLNDCCTKIPSFKDVHGNNSVQDEHGCSISLQTSNGSILSSLSCLEHPHDHLHITTFFNKRGKAHQSRAYNYVASAAVQDALGSMTTLMIIAWTITPRTVTARVKLNSQQITLWNNLNSLDLEEGSGDVNTTLHLEALRCPSQRSDSPFIPVSYKDLAIMPTIGKGDTAHITLSRRSDVTPVQGRYDLRDLIRLELTNHSYEEYRVTQGVARNYGDGQWAVYLNEPIRVNALFTGFY